MKKRTAPQNFISSNIVLEKSGGNSHFQKKNKTESIWSLVDVPFKDWLKEVFKRKENNETILWQQGGKRKKRKDRNIKEI